ncbi:sterol desaturase family protein [Novosphingobium lentum]|uniref:sterol desaturase family protein n=1 Tax=Novosphingobium lentum TaxID=145287 RepID=UPI00082B5159|nr:sterol desaturase family protein [Novosphingobium lentum]
MDTIVLVAGHMLHSVQIEFARYMAGAAGVAVLYYLVRNAIAHRRIQNRAATNADRRREFVQSVRAIAVFSVVNLITFAMIGKGLIPLNRGEPHLGVLLAQIVAMTVMHDTWFYWMHRSLHRPALFRATHATHHLSRTPTSWAAYSFAWGEAVAESIYIPAMFVIVSLVAPIEPWAAFIVMGHQIARNAFGHAGFELAWSGFTRSPLTRWMTTTTHHDLHHTEGKYNYGLYFTWWDRLMGTEHPRYHERFEAVATRRRDALPEQATA